MPELTWILHKKAAERFKSFIIQATIPNHKGQPLYEVLTAARKRQLTEAFKAQHKQRAGIEGTISQGVRAFGLRRARYWGQAKTGLQHIAIAAAMNRVRLGAWFTGCKLKQTRKSAFARAMAPLAACA